MHGDTAGIRNSISLSFQCRCLNVLSCQHILLVPLSQKHANPAAACLTMIEKQDQSGIRLVHEARYSNPAGHALFFFTPVGLRVVRENEAEACFETVHCMQESLVGVGLHGSR